MIAWWLAWIVLAPLQDLPDVRQLVTFKFAPGQSGNAIALFRDEALPLYQDAPAMLRFRGFREAESPEPLDLIVVSTFHGMAGMDTANRTLRERAAKAETSVGAIYSRIGALSEYHRDEFVEIDPGLSWGSSDAAPLVAFVSLRVAPGKSDAFEAVVREHVVPWEKEQGPGFTGSDGGRFLISDGWDYIRIIGVSSLGDWHHYARDQRSRAFWDELDSLVTHSKTILVAPVSELAIR